MDWFIVIQLMSKYRQESERYITLNSTSSDTPEFLGILFYCESNPNTPRKRLFDIDAIIKFKRTVFSKKFNLYRSNQYLRGRFSHPKLYYLSSRDRYVYNTYKTGFGTTIEVCLILLN